MRDKTIASDCLQAALATDVTPPAHPCPVCGKETKEHSVPGTRICSHHDCRAVSAASACVRP